MNLARTTYIVVNKYPERAKCVLYTVAVVTAFAFSFIWWRFATYLEYAQQWDATWGKTKTSQAYIDVIRSAGLPPDWEAPPRPTFWHVSFTGMDWVGYGLLALVATLVLVWMVEVFLHITLDKSEGPPN